MKAIWFKEFRLYTSFDRALWCALIWPFILALNPLFLETGESLSTAMIDAPGFANVALWHLVDPVLALTVSSIVAALCGAGAFAITTRVFRGRFIPTLRSDAGRYGHGMALEGMSVAVEHVTFGYGRRQTVLDDVSFTVPQGQSVAILGYNGVGKTTLFKLITGLLRPRSGRCVINGMLVTSMRDVFLMTEHANLISAMSVRDNIRFRGLLFDPDGMGGMDPSRLGGEPLVRAFELGPFLDTRVSRLSSGMRGRAGLVAGMLFDPHVIMLDEPTNSIDPITRDLLIDYVNRLHACGRTILTVTHDLEYCWKTTDRAVILDDRRIAGDVMLADIPDYETFTHIATLGHDRRTVDFGLERQMARSEE